MKKYNTVLTIAGSDSSGGAGIQADIKTISACGCYAASAITSVTVQNTLGVHDAFAVPVSVVASQIDAVLSDIGADAVKIGMLTCADTLCAVAESLNKYNIENTVLDTVFISSSGRHLLQPQAVEVMRTRLFPLCRLITPNIPEARTILKTEILSVDDMKTAARDISLLASLHRPVSVLLKGGHCDGDVLTDVLYNAENGKFSLYEAQKIESDTTHGTGCTLSSAIASYIARGLTLEESVCMGKQFVDNAIRAGADYKIGSGTGPLNHIFAINDTI